MARVVVVGGGLGGLAAAARLAKLGHEVTLAEAADRLGGSLGTISEEGFTWEAGPTWTLVPAVLRDLFRTSGRPLEREPGGELEPLPLLREHRFADGTALALPGGSRLAQREAFDLLSPGLGQHWDDYVAGHADTWGLLRRTYFEEPWEPASAPKDVTRLLEGRESLHRRLRRAFRDDRAADVAAFPLVAEGHDPRNVPSWVGLVSLLEQLFGAWHLPGGMHRLAELLADRLAVRGVTVLTRTPVRDVVVREGRAVGVALATGELAADVVVCAVDPRRLPTLAPHVERTMPALPPVVAHLGLEGVPPDLPDLPHEVVLHGDPLLVLRTGTTAGTAPAGCSAWTLHGRGRLAEDMLRVLARAGIDVRDRVLARVDRTPRVLVEQWGGSPLGVLWQGRGTVRRRLGPHTPVAGVLAAGASATPGAGLAHVGLSAAQVATVVGPA